MCNVNRYCEEGERGFLSQGLNQCSKKVLFKHAQYKKIFTKL
jgi:hypothetical protein